MRVLVVEDDYFLAEQLTSEILESGNSIVGPFADVRAAILCAEPVDAAILDVKVGEDTSFGIADALRSAEIPFLFVTGYDPHLVPPRFRDTRIYHKPSHAAVMLADLCAQRRRQRPAQVPESYEAIVGAMLAQARLRMPDTDSAERLVAAVLTEAIEACAGEPPCDEPRLWLFRLLEQELRLRWRLHLH